MNNTTSGGLPGLTARLRELKGDQSVAAFARRCGIGESLMRQYLAGGVPGMSWALKIARACGVSLDWLADDSSPKHFASTPYPLAAHEEIRPHIGEPAPDDGRSLGSAARHGLPCYDPARQPALRWNDAANHVGDFTYPAGWLVSHSNAAPDRVVVLVMRGDAMAPTFGDGDLLLLDTSARPLGQEGVCVLLLDGRLLVKRVQTLPEKRVRLQSDNPAYSPIDLADDWDSGGLQFVGRVLWRAGRCA